MRAKVAYLHLEAASLELDGEDDRSADRIREVMDVVWSDHMSPDERAGLNARGAVSPGPERIDGGEDGDDKDKT